MSVLTAATLVSALLVALPSAAAASSCGPGERCEASAAQPPKSAGNSFYQSSIVMSKTKVTEEDLLEDLRALKSGGLPGLDELDDEFGAGQSASLQAEDRPYMSSLPGLDELDDEFGFGAEVPPADPVEVRGTFTGYGADGPSAQWVLPPGALLNFILFSAEILIVVAGVVALLLRRRALRQEELKGGVSGPPSKRVVRA